MRLSNAWAVSKMPSHGTPYLDWVQDVALRGAPHGGSGSSFTYMFPVPKYAEAYAVFGAHSMGSWVSYLQYNHGNQPYNPIDSGLNTAFRTPSTPNWYTLSKVSPKSSTAAIQQAQTQLANFLSAKTPIGVGNLIGG